MVEPEDPVREFLRRKGCPDDVAQGGLRGLVESWEAFVESVGRGYPFTLEDYLNDLDGRQLLEEAFPLARPDERAEYADRVRRADEKMRAGVKPAGKCLWGDEVAESEGWIVEKNWWYFMKPIHGNPELLWEIDEE